MSDWNADLYLKYEKQRSQPAWDLAARVSKYAPEKIADLGCGPGNSTAILKSVFPEAQLTGIDNSTAMIEKARKTHPELDFRLGDLRELEESYDLIFSNACLHWVPDHASLLPALMNRLNDRGVLAVQVPMNGREPLYQIIRETADQSPYDFSSAYFEKNDVLTPEGYFEILSSCASGFEIWETVYYHDLPTHADLINWVRSARLRPYLDCLTEAEQKNFEAEILERVKQQYPVMGNDSVILKFRRLFFMAGK